MLWAISASLTAVLLWWGLRAREITDRAAAIYCIALAVASRLPFLFLHDGHGDAENSVRLVRQWMATGVYSQRWPGAVAYDLILAGLDRSATMLGIPYFYLTNPFSTLCVFVTLYCSYLATREGLGSRRALAMVTCFNFYPQELVIGAATYELNLLLALLAGAALAYSRGRLPAALALSVLALGAKLSAIALVAPLGVALELRYLRGQDWAKAVLCAALTAIGVVLLFLPRFLASSPSEFFAPFMGKTVYHADISKVTRVGAFLLRTLNALGFIGMPLLALLLLLHARRLRELPREACLVAGVFVLILVAMMYTAPWETYYLLPAIPLAFASVFWVERRTWIILLFVFSALLPNLVQVQLKPWKLPPWEVKQGVVAAHLHRIWVIRGGG